MQVLPHQAQGCAGNRHRNGKPRARHHPRHGDRRSAGGHEQPCYRDCGALYCSSCANPTQVIISRAGLAPHHRKINVLLYLNHGLRTSDSRYSYRSCNLRVLFAQEHSRYPREEQERAEARRYEGYGQVNTRNDGGYYDNNVGYQTSGGYQGGQNVQSNHNYQIGNGSYDGAIASTVLSISELSYMDADGDGYISKDETIEVEGFITNTSNSVLRDIVIYLNVSEPKSFSVSPSLTTTLQPGQKIRYTGRVHGNRTRGHTSLGINLSTEYAGKTYTSNTLFVGVK